MSELDSLEHMARELCQQYQYDSDQIVESIYQQAADITSSAVTCSNADWMGFENRVDNIVTSRLWGFPIMFGLLALIFWITITGANYPSAVLADLFFEWESWLTSLCQTYQVPGWVHGFFVLGVFRCTAWVVSVMLPPMAIFFPLFTLLEDAGYLPRVAFNMDSLFKKAGAHGKQALTMCMGFGCNAAGCVSCRIIDSPRERLIAILTNNFVPCNGRFPTLIVLASIFFGGSAILSAGHLAATFAVALIVVMGVILTLAVSRILSQTLLQGKASHFTLELPSYRKPRVGEVILRSILDRTLFVLGRAVIIAAPAGGIIWILANTMIGDASVISLCASYLDIPARWMGLDGFILLAFILGLPANEIVLPILIMSYVSGGAVMELDSLDELRNLFVVEHGWTWLTALCTMIFTLCHWPCGTTLYTIQREQKSWKWTFLAALIPTVTGILLCVLVNGLVSGLLLF